MGPAAVIPIFAAAAIGGELISNSSRSSQGKKLQLKYLYL